jgi:hypothetical protein
MLAAATAEADLVDRMVFYVGDEPIPSAAWLDGFSCVMTDKPVRRVPEGALRTLAEAGELMKRVGVPAPIDRGRFYRITTDYRVPMESALAVLGAGSVSLEQGIAETVDWLREALPQEYRR